MGVFNGPDRPRRVAKFLDLLGKLDFLVALGINAILLLQIVEIASGRSSLEVNFLSRKYLVACN